MEQALSKKIVKTQFTFTLLLAASVKKKLYNDHKIDAHNIK